MSRLDIFQSSRQASVSNLAPIARSLRRNTGSYLEATSVNIRLYDMYETTSIHCSFCLVIVRASSRRNRLSERPYSDWNELRVA